jgi:hypothetical protein
MKEDVMHPSFFFFYQQAWQERLIRLRLAGYVAIGCIFILQAVRFQAKRDLPTSDAPPPPLFKAVKGRFNLSLQTEQSAPQQETFPFMAALGGLTFRKLTASYITLMCSKGVHMSAKTRKRKRLPLLFRRYIASVLFCIGWLPYYFGADVKPKKKPLTRKI